MIEPVGDPRLPVSWALGYAERGIVVIPVERLKGISHSMLSRGWSFNDSGSIDPDQIREWWTEDPLANVGIVPGMRSRIVILDLDMKGHKDGVAAWKTWLGDRTLDGTEWYAHTPSGGWHIWFNLPPGQSVPRRPGWLPGVDVLGAGGLAVVPPSAKYVPITSPRPWEPPTTVLRTYEWYAEYSGDRPGDAPQWLIDEFINKPSTPATDQDGNPVESIKTPLPELERFLVEGFGIGNPEDSRNRDAFDVMMLLLRRVDNQDEKFELSDALMMMRMIWARTRDTGSFPWHEVEKAMRSAGQYHRRAREMTRKRYLQCTPERVQEELRRRGMR